MKLRFFLYLILVVFLISCSQEDNSEDSSDSKQRELLRAPRLYQPIEVAGETNPNSFISSKNIDDSSFQELNCAEGISGSLQNPRQAANFISGVNDMWACRAQVVVNDWIETLENAEVNDGERVRWIWKETDRNCTNKHIFRIYKESSTSNAGYPLTTIYAVRSGIRFMKVELEELPTGKFRGSFVQRYESHFRIDFDESQNLLDTYIRQSTGDLRFTSLENESFTRVLQLFYQFGETPDQVYVEINPNGSGRGKVVNAYSNGGNPIVQAWNAENEGVIVNESYFSDIDLYSDAYPENYSAWGTGTSNWFFIHNRQLVFGADLPDITKENCKNVTIPQINLEKATIVQDRTGDTFNSFTDIRQVAYQLTSKRAIIEISFEDLSDIVLNQSGADDDSSEFHLSIEFDVENDLKRGNNIIFDFIQFKDPQAEANTVGDFGENFFAFIKKYDPDSELTSQITEIDAAVTGDRIVIWARLKEDPILLDLEKETSFQTKVNYLKSGDFSLDIDEQSFHRSFGGFQGEQSTFIDDASESGLDPVIDIKNVTYEVQGDLALLEIELSNIPEEILYQTGVSEEGIYSWSVTFDLDRNGTGSKDDVYLSISLQKKKGYTPITGDLFEFVYKNIGVYENNTNITFLGNSILDLQVDGNVLQLSFNKESNEALKKLNNQEDLQFFSYKNSDSSFDFFGLEKEIKRSSVSGESIQLNLDFSAVNSFQDASADIQEVYLSIYQSNDTLVQSSISAYFDRTTGRILSGFVFPSSLDVYNLELIAELGELEMVWKIDEFNLVDLSEENSVSVAVRDEDVSDPIILEEIKASNISTELAEISNTGFFSDATVDVEVSLESAPNTGDIHVFATLENKASNKKLVTELVKSGLNFQNSIELFEELGNWRVNISIVHIVGSEIRRTIDYIFKSKQDEFYTRSINSGKAEFSTNIPTEIVQLEDIDLGYFPAIASVELAENDKDVTVKTIDSQDNWIGWYEIQFESGATSQFSFPIVNNQFDFSIGSDGIISEIGVSYEQIDYVLHTFTYAPSLSEIYYLDSRAGALSTIEVIRLDENENIETEVTGDPVNFTSFSSSINGSATDITMAFDKTLSEVGFGFLQIIYDDNIYDFQSFNSENSVSSTASAHEGTLSLALVSSAEGISTRLQHLPLQSKEYYFDVSKSALTDVPVLRIPAKVNLLDYYLEFLKKLDGTYDVILHSKLSPSVLEQVDILGLKCSSCSNFLSEITGYNLSEGGYRGIHNLQLFPSNNSTVNTSTSLTLFSFTSSGVVELDSNSVVVQAGQSIQKNSLIHVEFTAE